MQHPGRPAAGAASSATTCGGSRDIDNMTLGPESPRPLLLMLLMVLPHAVDGGRAPRAWPFKFRSMYTNPCHLAPPVGNLVADARVRTGVVEPADEWRNLPMVFGGCSTTPLVRRTPPRTPQCFVQHLQSASARGLGTMLVLQTSGPFVTEEPATFENGTANPHARYHTTIADDCSWPPSARPWGYHNASTAPARGVCGLKWLSQTLDFVRSFVQNGE